MLPAVWIPQEFLSNAFLVLACVSMGAFSSNHWALTQRLAGAEAAGKWTGLENCIGNFSGVVAPYISGVTLEKTHSFFSAFAIACGILLVGVFGYWVVVGSPVQVSWSEPVTIHPPQAYIKDSIN